MTLQTKIVLSILSTLLLLVLALYVPLQQFLLGGFITIEEQAQRTNLERVTNALNYRLHTLETLNSSYAVWDDTYAFVQQPNGKYIIDNWYNSFLTEAQINLVVISDSDGRVVYSKGFDTVTQQERPVPARFQRLKRDDPLLQHKTLTSTVTGLLLIPDHLLLISTHPIITSQSQGPSRGTLMMGRYLDEQELARIAQTTQNNLYLHRLDDPSDADLHGLHDQVRAGTTTVIRTPSDTLIEGYTHVPDLAGGPGILLHMEAPRAIYAQGVVSVRSFIGVLLVTTAGLGLGLFIILDRVVLSRLTSLSQHLRGIGSERDLGARVVVQGNDELSDLAATLNEMLQALERAQVEHQQHLAAREAFQIQTKMLEAKREFISLVSHELRTPLTPILGFTELILLDTDTLPVEHVEALDTIKLNAERLRRLVDDLLDLGRLEAHKLTLALTHLQLADVVAEARELLKDELERKQFALQVELSPDLPAIEADYQRLVQIVVNLLSNAIKYTSAGGAIAIRAVLTEGDMVEVSISDSGIGLSAEQQAQVFMPFYRVDRAGARQERGSGLGLTIVRSLVELHDGRIWVESKPGVGSRFSFSLPLRQSSAVAQREEAV